jgi:hypothetical protein
MYVQTLICELGKLPVGTYQTGALEMLPTRTDRDVGICIANH